MDCRDEFKKLGEKTLQTLRKNKPFDVLPVREHDHLSRRRNKTMSDNAESLAVEFHECMNTIYDKGAKRGFYPIRFLQMLQKYGGVETAKRLLAKKEIQARLMRLHELKLLDASMEAYVVQERYHSLFTEEERAEARRRLEELGYFG